VRGKGKGGGLSEKRGGRDEVGVGGDGDVGK